jgi:hypothetical protein
MGTEHEQLQILPPIPRAHSQPEAAATARTILGGFQQKEGSMIARYIMRPELYRKFRSDLLEWSRQYRELEELDYSIVGTIGRRAVRKQMLRLRQAYFVGNILY